MVSSDSYLNLSLDEVIARLKKEPEVFLNTEQAIAYFAWAILERRGGDYATSIRDRCPAAFPGFRVSDTMVYQAIRYWHRKGGALNLEQRRPEGGGRGRTQNVYSFKPEAHEMGLNLAAAWKDFYRRAIDA